MKTENAVQVCKIDELEEGRAKTFDIEGVDICLAKVEGQIYAFDNVCTHDGGILGEGEIEDFQIACPRHGATFDIISGDATRMPAVVGINTYKVIVEGDEVFISLEE